MNTFRPQSLPEIGSLMHPVQSYREGSYQSAFDLYTQLLDTSEPVRSLRHVADLT